MAAISKSKGSNNLLELLSKMATFEEKLEEISQSIVNLNTRLNAYENDTGNRGSETEDTVSKEKGCYHNWDKQHDVLKTHSYVSLILFLRVLNNCRHNYNNTNNINRSVSDLLKSVFKINKHTRFKSSGKYLYLNQDVICKIYFMLGNLFSVSLDKTKSSIDEIIADVKPNAPCDVFDCESFEAKYELEWVD